MSAALAFPISLLPCFTHRSRSYLPFSEDDARSAAQSAWHSAFEADAKKPAQRRPTAPSSSSGPHTSAGSAEPRLYYFFAELQRSGELELRVTNGYRFWIAIENVAHLQRATTSHPSVQAMPQQTYARTLCAALAAQDSRSTGYAYSALQADAAHNHSLVWDVFFPVPQHRAGGGSASASGEVKRGLAARLTFTHQKNRAHEVLALLERVHSHLSFTLLRAQTEKKHRQMVAAQALLPPPPTSSTAPSAAAQPTTSKLQRSSALTATPTAVSSSTKAIAAVDVEAEDAVKSERPKRVKREREAVVISCFYFSKSSFNYFNHFFFLCNVWLRSGGGCKSGELRRRNGGANHTHATPTLPTPSSPASACGYRCGCGCTHLSSSLHRCTASLI